MVRDGPKRRSALFGEEIPSYLSSASEIPTFLSLFPMPLQLEIDRTRLVRRGPKLPPGLKGPESGNVDAVRASSRRGGDRVYDDRAGRWCPR